VASAHSARLARDAAITSRLALALAVRRALDGLSFPSLLRAGRGPSRTFLHWTAMTVGRPMPPPGIMGLGKSEVRGVVPNGAQCSSGTRSSASAEPALIVDLRRLISRIVAAV